MGIDIVNLLLCRKQTFLYFSSQEAKGLSNFSVPSSAFEPAVPINMSTHGSPVMFWT